MINKNDKKEKNVRKRRKACLKQAKELKAILKFKARGFDISFIEKHALTDASWFINPT